VSVIRLGPVVGPEVRVDTWVSLVRGLAVRDGSNVHQSEARTQFGGL